MCLSVMYFSLEHLFLHDTITPHATSILFILETVLFVREYILANPDIERNTSHVIEGWGWDHASWDVEKMPTWVSPQRPFARSSANLRFSNRLFILHEIGRSRSRPNRLCAPTYPPKSRRACNLGIATYVRGEWALSWYNWWWCYHERRARETYW